VITRRRSIMGLAVTMLHPGQRSRVAIDPLAGTFEAERVLLRGKRPGQGHVALHGWRLAPVGELDGALWCDYGLPVVFQQGSAAAWLDPVGHGVAILEPGRALVLEVEAIGKSVQLVGAVIGWVVTSDAPGEH